MIKERIKKIKYNDLVGLIVVTIIFGLVIILKLVLKDTHAFYNSATNPIPIFTGKIGNFAKQDIEEFLVSQKDSGLETIENMTARGDTLRRYQGVNVNNYICFGASSINDCIKNMDKYMYRIMGIDTVTKELKLIKKEALEEPIVWDSNGSPTWAAVNVQTNLNTNGFYNNTNYIPSDWKTYIVNHDWKYGDNTTVYNVEATTLFATENGWKDTISKPIGLQYVSDYYLAGSNSANCYGNYTAAGVCVNSWIYIKNNDSNPPGTTKYSEWYMSRGYQNRGWYIKDIGKPSDDSPTSSQFALRPTFFVKNNIKIGGKGTQEEPFIIAGSKPVIINVNIINDTGTSVTVEVKAIDDKSVAEYCYKLNTEDKYTCTSSKTQTFTVEEKVNYSLEVYVKDGDNNSSDIMYSDIFRILKRTKKCLACSWAESSACGAGYKGCRYDTWTYEKGACTVRSLCGYCWDGPQIHIKQEYIPNSNGYCLCYYEAITKYPSCSKCTFGCSSWSDWSEWERVESCEAGTVTTESSSVETECME